MISIQAILLTESRLISTVAHKSLACCLKQLSNWWQWTLPLWTAEVLLLVLIWQSWIRLELCTTETKLTIAVAAILWYKLAFVIKVFKLSFKVKTWFDIIYINCVFLSSCVASKGSIKLVPICWYNVCFDIPWLYNSFFCIIFFRPWV